MNSVTLSNGAAIAEIGTVIVAVLGATWKITSKIQSWKESVDEHLGKQDQRLDTIEKELRPNGGGSHHDLILNEIRKGFAEESRDPRRRR